MKEKDALPPTLLHARRTLRRAAGWVCLIAGLGCAPAFADQQPIQVLVILYGNSAHHSLAPFVDGFRRTLTDSSGRSISVYVETLDEYGPALNPKFEATFEAFLREKYAPGRIDLVVAIGRPSLAFIAPRRADLFPKAKLLYVLFQAEAVPDATGVILPWNLVPTAELALRLHPGTKRLLLITGASPADQTGVPELKQALDKYSSSTGKALRVETLPPQPLAETRKYLSRLSPDTICLFVSYYTDSEGRVFVPSDLLPMLSQSSSRPIYSSWDTDIGIGTVGGSVIHVPEVGKAVAYLAVRVLREDDPNSVPPVHAEFQSYVFDWPQLVRWNIAIDRLPPGSIIANREYTPWERYRTWILGGILLVVIQTTLILQLLRMHAARKRAQQALIAAEQLKSSVLESMGLTIAVLDASGRVIASNHHWDEHLQSRGLDPKQAVRTATYFELASSHGEFGELTTAAFEGIREVCEEKRKRFELEYSSGPADNRAWTVMTATPMQCLPGGVVVTHRNVTRRKKNEEAVRGLRAKLITAQEEERSHIARELHDDISQQLAIVAIEAQKLGDACLTSRDHQLNTGIRGVQEGLAEGAPPDVRAKTDELWHRVVAVSSDIQALSHKLHSTKLDHLGLQTALRGLCREFSLEQSMEVGFEAESELPKLDQDVALALFRVAQESLHNVAKHGQAKSVRVCLGTGPQSASLRIEDDGVGFAAEGNDWSGIGLINMRERMQMVKGSFTVWSEVGKGTVIEATAPVALVSTDSELLAPAATD